MDLLFRAEPIAFFLLVIIYVLGKKYIESRERKIHRSSDEEYLASIAAERNCSEYDLFRVAAAKWRIADSRVEDDFKRYLTQGDLPHYLRDFVRKNRKNGDLARDNHMSPGGKLPPSWSA